MVYDQLILLGAPILRSVSGWLSESLKNGTIELYEWKRLIKTIVRLGVPAIALYYGLNLSPEVAAALPLIADYIFDYVKKAVRVE